MLYIWGKYMGVFFGGGEGEGERRTANQKY